MFLPRTTCDVDAVYARTGLSVTVIKIDCRVRSQMTPYRTCYHYQIAFLINRLQSRAQIRTRVVV